MGKYQFGVKGQERKNLVTAVCEILGESKKYNPGQNLFQIGEYIVDKDGALIGEQNNKLLLTLMARGFTQTDVSLDDLLEAEAAPMETTQDENGIIVEMPLEGWSPEKIDNLCRMVNAKEPLIKAALGADAIPIQVTAESIKFPWFWGENALQPDEVTAYSTLISLICKTAKEKTRVTAQPKELPENPKYAMRCWLLSLGMIGKEYSDTRRILLSRLEGDSSWKGGKPPKAATPTDEPRSEYEMLMEQRKRQIEPPLYRRGSI